MESEWPEMEQRGPVVTEADVAAFEKRLGFTLPDDYRAFLLAVNGGRLDARNRRFEWGTVNWLLSLRDSDESSDIEERRDLEPSPQLLFVGYDGFGCRLLVVLDGAHRGEVWYFDRLNERPVDANPRVAWHDRRDMKKLAGSWREFVATLGPIDGLDGGSTS